MLHISWPEGGFRLLGPCLVVGAVACNYDVSSPAGPIDAPPDLGPDPLSCDVEWEPRCDHPVDRELVPRYRQFRVEPVVAEPAEYCRRLAIDLLGRIPTTDEMAACEASEPGDAVDMFMSMDEYADEEQRYWIGELGYDTAVYGYYLHALDLIELAGQLGRGEITYDQFASQVIVHPGFIMIYGSEHWGAAVFRTFLGRRPRPDEIAGMGNLSRIFVNRSFHEGRVFQDAMDLCLEQEDATEDDCRDLALMQANAYEFFTDFSACSGFRCSTSALGTQVDIPRLMEGGPYHRLIAIGAGDLTTCNGRSGECVDYDQVYEPMALPVPLTPFPELSEGQALALASIGTALVARGDFWEYAADRQLLRFTGWWQQTLRQPDFDVPGVRRALAIELAQTRDLRGIQRLILTSMLYRASIARPTRSRPSTTEPPPWASGPLKLMAGDVWVRSAAMISGEYLGACELGLLSAEEAQVRFLRSSYRYTGFFPAIPPHTLTPDYFDPNIDYFIKFSNELGGCQPGRRATAPNLSTVTNRRTVATQLCAVGQSIVPPDFDSSDLSEPSLDRVATHLMQQIFSRAPSEEELTLLRADLSQCLSSSELCTDANIAARWLCQEMLSSPRFTLY